jgi:formyltetrahydrofolate synthetase
MNITELCDELFNQVNTSEDLRLVWDTAKAIQDKVSHLAKRGFSIGQEVQFESKQGLVQGRVSKINKKSIKVTSLGGRLWRVSPTLLSPLSMER